MQELKDIRVWELKIRQRMEQAEKLRQAALLLKAPSPNPDKVQASRDGSQLEEIVVKLVALENKIKQMITGLESKRARVINKIHKLDDARHIDVLYKRYVECKSYKRIADEMEISAEYVPHLIHKAINKYKKL